MDSENCEKIAYSMFVKLRFLKSGLELKSKFTYSEKANKFDEISKFYSKLLCSIEKCFDTFLWPSENV